MTRSHVGADTTGTPLAHQDGNNGVVTDIGWGCDAVALTSASERVLRHAQQRGFRVRTVVAGGRVLHYLDQHGEGGCFGVIYTGPRTGRITGALLNQGNTDTRGTR